MKQGGEFELNWSWRNAGVAPFLPGGFPALTLKNERGAVVAVWADEWDLRGLPVGAADASQAVGKKTRFRVPAQVAPGRYEAFASVGTRTGPPKIQLPLEGGDGRNRYRLGRLEVEPQ